MIYLLLSAVLFILLILYFKIAIRFGIVDSPNYRSSHSEVTIRGGGIVIFFSILFLSMVSPVDWIPILSAFIIGLVSFWDDVKSLSTRLRLFFQILALSGLFFYLDVYSIFQWYWVVVIYLFSVAMLNIYNFMDGINGITGMYSLCILAGLLYINLIQKPFIRIEFISFPIMGCIIFLFFNFRKKAMCFAGDIGSITIAFWIIFLIYKLILSTGNFIYLLLLEVYAIDGGLTILQRILHGENIFLPHRSHLYQLLSNREKIPQLTVSSVYSCTQLIITLLIVLFPGKFLLIFCVSFIPLCILYLIIKARHN